MDLILAVAFCIFLYIMIARSSKNTSKPHYTIYSGHGHRCYAEGLNESEKIVVRVLAEGLSHKEYFIFNNLIVPSTHSVSTQIDHIVVSRFGIFVIETKDNAGWVFGSKNNENWTLTYRGGQKFVMRNPVWQNYGHVETLKKLLPFAEDYFINLVVFTGIGTFKTERISNVVYSHELVQNIKSHTKPIISQQRLMMAIGKLSYLCQTIDLSDLDHKTNLKKLIEAK